MIDAFDDIRFPEDISYGSIGGPEFSTDIITMQSGKEQRNMNWQNDRIKYNVAPGIKNKTQLIELINFFRARRGKARSFRFKDWLDYSVKNEYLGEYNNTNNKFQLHKSYKSGNQIYKKKIIKPIKETFVIWINNQVLSDKDYDLNDKGIVTIKGGIYGSVFASFEYDIIVRFDSDFLPIALDNFNSYEVQNILIIEVKV